MASAEQLLHDAHYAFHNIGFGESRDNRRNAAKARKLARKIIRKYPTSMEAGEAHAILRRLGDEAFVSKMPTAHRHIEHAKAHRSPSPRPLASTGPAAPSPAPKPLANPGPSLSPPASGADPMQDDVTVLFDWGGLLAVILATPKFVLGIIGFVALVLFGIFGWFLLIPPIIFALATSPWREPLNPKQRKDMNDFIRRANDWIRERRDSGTGLT